MTESRFRSALANAPNDAGLWHNLGLSLLPQNRSTDAATALNRSYQLHADPGTFALLTTAYCSLGDKTAIEPRLRQAKRCWTDSKVLSQLLDCYARYGDPLDSVLAYRAAVGGHLQPIDRNLVGLARAYMTAARTFLVQLKSAPNGELYVAAMQSTQNGDADAAAGALSRSRRQR